jgi:iron complex outermembrane receptor protein
MFKRTRLSASLLLAFTGAAALAQPQETQRIEITGSSIKRIAAEGALPMLTLTRTDIDKSGAGSVSELIQRLPSMQGFTTVSDSVNGGGGGTTTASVHALGSAYTLVLLNGRRVAPFNTGSTVNLESIPLSAVERVEVLLDGASAVYGSDAIGGVVNFILRRNQIEGEMSVSVQHVEQGGGASASGSVTKGFGDLDRDGFNLLASLAFDRQQQLKAGQRSFSKSGIIRGIDGQNVGMRLFSSNSVPGNVLLFNPAGTALAAFFSPELQREGACPAFHVVNGAICSFDFPSQVDLVPESQRVTGLLSGRLKLSPDHQLFSELVLSNYYNKPTFAQPAQPNLPINATLFARHIQPHLAALGLTPAQIGTLTDGNPDNDPLYNLRVFDAGGRRNQYTYKTTHWAFGAEGLLAGWDYKSALTLSRQLFTDEAIGGYLSANRFNALIASDTFDPLGMGPGEGVAALRPAVLQQELDRNLSTYHSLNASASRPLFKFGAGDVSLALGGEVAQQTFKNDPSLILQGVGDSIIGAGSGTLPFDTTRRSAGVFSELLVPLTKQLEVSGSVRFDSYGAAVNRRAFDIDGNPVAGNRDEGKKANAATWKLSTRYQPNPQTLLRASVGTGFKAPTLANITLPLQDGGVTAGSYDCPFAAPDPLAVGCQPPDSQYNILQGGNASKGAAALKPEKSTQFTFGALFEPSGAVSLGIDYWQVKLEDQIANIPVDLAFSDPVAFRRLFTVVRNPVNGRNELRVIQQPVNIAQVKNSGIDLNATLRTNTALGKVTTTLGGTYVIKADFTVPGVPEMQSSLGKFDANSAVVFRWQLAGAVTLDSGNWSTTLKGNYRSGYRDHEARCADPALTAAQCTAAGLWLGPDIRSVNPTTGAFGGRIAFARRVAEYFTVDLQTRYSVTKALDVTLGIKNLLDEDPPFSVQDGGGGNQRGFDGRYADPLGRTWTLKANYRF